MKTKRFRELPSKMDKETFMNRFGGVYEHSAWVAEQLWNDGLTDEYDSLESMSKALQSIFHNATQEQQLAVLRAHPDLAGRAAISNELTLSSTNEQSSAGLDQCNAEEYKHFQEYNDNYKSKFEFPFIMAVKDSDRREILDRFAERLKNDLEQEFQTALDEVGKIALLRLTELTEAK